jgi:hypothetical protein
MQAADYSSRGRCDALSAARAALNSSRPETRIDLLIALWRNGTLTGEEWLGLLKAEWNSCDNLNAHSDTLWNDTPLGWLTVLTDLRKFVMTECELAAFQALPADFTLYRSCTASKQSGFCWTLDRDAAVLSTREARERTTSRVIMMTAPARREQVAAVKLGSASMALVAMLPRQAARFSRALLREGTR